MMRFKNVSCLLRRPRIFKTIMILFLISTMSFIILTLGFENFDPKINKFSTFPGTKVYTFQEINWEIMTHRKVSWFDRSDAEKMKTELLTGGTTILEELSANFQQHLTSVQKSDSSCADIDVAIQCGTNHGCGFGCNLHHHIGCMMLSYAFDMPLIQDTTSHWLYSEPWHIYLNPIGSSCSNSTVRRIIRWNWGDFADPENLFNFPLKNGLPLPTEFSRLLYENHKNPFLWLVGQFVQNVFQLNDETLEEIQNFKKSLKISPQHLTNGNKILIGMHVRRTDKYRETSVILNSTNFMTSAMDYRKERLDQSQRDEEIIIFIASEDCSVIPEFRKSYPSAEWKFVGSCEQTLATPSERRNHLFEIIRDIHILAECDFVVCTHTSNICNLVLEIRSFRQTSDPEHGLISLDGMFNLLLWHVHIINPSLVLI